MEKEEFAYIPCTCSCHYTPGVIHVVACCHNGLVAVRKNQVKDQEMIGIVFGKYFKEKPTD